MSPTRDLRGGRMSLEFLSRYRETGLFLLRLGIGTCFVIHGWPKIAAGPEGWEGLGAQARDAGISFSPKALDAVLGFLSAVAEFGGGICFALGILFRPACLLMAANMAVALSWHLHKDQSFEQYSHALECLILFVGFALIGPGKIGVERG